VQTEKKTSLRSIQLLRGIAALGVVYCHYALYAFLQAANGAFGVDIFFVISGFIIAYVASKTIDNFFLKRIFRIVPLYFIATFITISAALIFPQWFYNTTVTIEAVLKSILFIPYKIGTSGPILLAGWTLNFEMLFYLAMALSIIITKNKKVLTIFCAAILITFLLLLNIINTDNYALHFYQRGLLPEFIYGLILFRVYEYYNKYDSTQTNKIRHQKIISTLLLVFVALSSLLLLICNELPNSHSTHISEDRNIQFGIPALLFVGSILFLEKNIKANSHLIKFGLLVGNASFAMYLFHPYFIYFLQRVIYPKALGQMEGISIEIFKMLTAFIVTIIGSIFIYRYIDDPIQKYLSTRLKK